MVAQAIPLLLGPVLSRVFTPEDFAVYEIYLTVGGLFAVVACLRFEMAIMLPKTIDESLKIVRANMRLSWIIAGVCGVLVYSFSGYLTDLTQSQKLFQFLWAIPLFVVLTGWYQSFYNFKSREKKFKSVATGRIVQSSGVNGFPLALQGFNSGGFSLILGHLLGLAGSIATLWDKRYLQGERAHFKTLFKTYKDFPLINAPHVFADQLLQRFGITLLLMDQFGPAFAAFFALSNKYLKGPLRLIANSVSIAFFQQSAEESNNQQTSTSTVLKTSVISLAIGLPMLIILGLYGGPIFSWVFGEQWEMAGTISSIMVWALFSNFLSSPVSTLPIVKGKQKQAFIYAILGQGIPLLLTFGMIRGMWMTELNWFDTPALNALSVYAATSSLYFMLLWIWYLKLARQ